MMARKLRLLLGVFVAVALLAAAVPAEAATVDIELALLVVVLHSFAPTISELCCLIAQQVIL